MTTLTHPPVWTPNQLVADRVAAARRLRGWTQRRTARELEPYLGTRLSVASFSALERSTDTDRIRRIDADTLVALARCFHLPVGWFLTPPASSVRLRTPDTPDGHDPGMLFDVVLGDPVGLADWTPALHAAHRVVTDSTPPVQERLDHLTRLRVRRRLHDLFGDTAAAKVVLSALAGALDGLGDDAGGA